MKTATYPQSIPWSLVVLALLAIADGITTHIGLAVGITEFNPLFATLFAWHLWAAWLLYAGGWAAVLYFVWWAHSRCGRRWWRFWVGFGVTGKGCIVVWNVAQLARMGGMWA